MRHRSLPGYDPALNFKGVEAKEKLEIPPGPNNPVGIVWIGLNREGYGIHGRQPLRPSARLHRTVA
jgi:hypothetical protein